VRVDGPFIVNNIAVNREAAMAGLGLAIVLEDQITEQLAGGTLVRVLEDWCPPFPGYHLYYPSRRQLSPAFAVVVSALRFRG
jgi:DNA-binding transcriptional LysR family regulator